jgi:hypothetical protein
MRVHLISPEEDRQPDGSHAAGGTDPTTSMTPAPARLARAARYEAIRGVVEVEQGGADVADDQADRHWTCRVSLVAQQQDERTR